jgi:hypothetical protein
MCRQRAAALFTSNTKNCNQITRLAQVDDFSIGGGFQWQAGFELSCRDEREKNRRGQLSPPVCLRFSFYREPDDYQRKVPYYAAETTF